MKRLLLLSVLLAACTPGVKPVREVGWKDILVQGQITVSTPVSGVVLYANGTDHAWAGVTIRFDGITKDQVVSGFLTCEGTVMDTVCQITPKLLPGEGGAIFYKGNPSLVKMAFVDETEIKILDVVKQ